MKKSNEKPENIIAETSDKEAQEKVKVQLIEAAQEADFILMVAMKDGGNETIRNCASIYSNEKLETHQIIGSLTKAINDERGVGEIIRTAIEFGKFLANKHNKD